MKTNANQMFSHYDDDSGKDDDDDDDVAEDGPAKDAGRGVFSTRLSRDLRPEGQGPAQGQLQVQKKYLKKSE
jgi:hypothetical protein